LVFLAPVENDFVFRHSVSVLVYFHQSISNQHLANLLDLIRFGEGASRLKVKDLIHSIARENVVASSDALGEAES
jgi:hypothetical protein